MGGHRVSPQFCPEASVVGRALSLSRDWSPAVKRAEEVVKILEAYDLTGSLRQAAVLASCDHKTVTRLIAVREVAGGGLPERVRRRPLVDPFGEDRRAGRSLARADWRGSGAPQACRDEVSGF
jgi:hypothetical protein